MSLAPDLADRVGSVFQYLAGIGVVAIVGLQWRAEREASKTRAEFRAELATMAERVKGIEVVLMHPEVGMTKSVNTVRERQHETNNRVQKLEGLVDGFSADIERVEHDVEQLQLNQLVRVRQSDKEIRT